MFFAQIFRIVRAVPETLNSGAFLVQKIAFGASKISIFREISKKSQKKTVDARKFYLVYPPDIF